MSLLGFLGGVSSLFGGGGKSSSSSQTTSSSGSSEQAATAQEDSKSNTTSNTSASGTSNTTGSSITNQTGSEKTNTTGTTTSYSADVLASLDALLSGQLANGGAEQTSDALQNRLKQLTDLANQPEFDVNGYVSGIAQAASVATQTDLDSQINSMLSATGTSEGGNSMSALLGQKLRNNAAASLAGIVSNAQATGNQIKQQQQESITGQIGSLGGDIMTNIANLLAAAKGGQTQTSGSANTQTQQQQGTTQQQSTSEQQQQQSTSATTGSTTQQGVTQTTENQTSTTKGTTKQNSGDLFTRITAALTDSAKAA